MSIGFVIIGAGGFGREVLDVFDDVAAHGGLPDPGIEFLGFIDDGAPDLDALAALGARHLGAQEVLSTLPAGTYYAVGIGDGTARRRMCHQAEAAGLRPLTLIHSTATHGRCASFGEGAIICAGVRITTNVTVGKQVHINLNCSIGHDAVLGDFTSINPLSAISGWVHLGEEVLIGAHSQVNQNLSVGDGATVGAGAVAVKDVAAGTTVVGIPAKPLTRG